MMLKRTNKANLRNCSPFRQLLSLLVLLTVVFAEAIAQDGHQKVTGTVVSSSGNQPLPGVNVVVKGTTNGTITNFDGQYQLNAAQGDVIVFSFIGFNS